MMLPIKIVVPRHEPIIPQSGFMWLKWEDTLNVSLLRFLGSRFEPIEDEL